MTRDLYEQVALLNEAAGPEPKGSVGTLTGVAENRPHPASAAPPERPEGVAEWMAHMDLHLTEHDERHAGLALRSAWPHVRAYTERAEQERDLLIASEARLAQQRDESDRRAERAEQRVAEKERERDEARQSAMNYLTDFQVLTKVALDFDCHDAGELSSKLVAGESAAAALAEARRDAERYEWILREPEAARHLLHLLQQGKGDKEAFSTMVDRIVMSKAAAPDRREP